MKRLASAMGLCAIAMLGACLVQPPPPQRGEYSDYRAMAHARTKQVDWRGVPADLAQRAWACRIETELAIYTPDELTKADAYARGEEGVSTGDLWRIQHDVFVRMGREAGIQSAMEQTCPAVVADLRALFAASPPQH
jgi:hypothetical protein